MTAVLEIPFDFASAQASGDSWRRNFAWPIAPSEATPALDAQLTRLMRFIADLDVTPERECVILCAPRILFRVRALTETALAIKAEASRGLRLVGGPLEVTWLRGDITGEAPKSETSEQLAKVMDGGVRHAFFRRLIRIASWTPLMKLPQILLAPEILAITHSDLVRKESKRSGQRTNFFHAHSILASARRRFSGCSADFHIGNLVERLTDVLAAVEELTPDMRVRLRALMCVEVDWRLHNAAIDLAALTEEPKLPKLFGRRVAGRTPLAQLVSKFCAVAARQYAMIIRGRQAFPCRTRSSPSWSLLLLADSFLRRDRLQRLLCARRLGNSFIPTELLN